MSKRWDGPLLEQASSSKGPRAGDLGSPHTDHDTTDNAIGLKVK